MDSYQRLESAIAQWAGVKHVVACSSGTAALHLALESLELPLGSQVIVPDFCMIAVPRAVVMAGLVPVFVDCTSRLLLNTDLLEFALSTKTIAILPVHIYGRACDMDTIHEFATGYDLTIVEDMAELHGDPPHSDTDAACWSFYRNKIVHGEEGGAVAFLRERDADLARQLRTLGFTDKHDFMHLPRGHNYRMSNVHAEMVLASLQEFEQSFRWRRQMESAYDAACPEEWRMPPRQSPWVYDIRIPGLTNERQTAIVKAIPGARYAFKPMSIQPEFSQCRSIGNGSALKASREIVYLPLHPGINAAVTFATIRAIME